MKRGFQIIEQHCSQISIYRIYHNFSARTGWKSEHSTSCVSSKLEMIDKGSLNKAVIKHICKVLFKDFGK